MLYQAARKLQTNPGPPVHLSVLRRMLLLPINPATQASAPQQEEIQAPRKCTLKVRALSSVRLQHLHAGAPFWDWQRAFAPTGHPTWGASPLSPGLAAALCPRPWLSHHHTAWRRHLPCWATILSFVRSHCLRAPGTRETRSAGADPWSAQQVLCHPEAEVVDWVGH